MTKPELELAYHLHGFKLEPFGKSYRFIHDLMRRIRESQISIPDFNLSMEERELLWRIGFRFRTRLKDEIRFHTHLNFQALFEWKQFSGEQQHFERLLSHNHADAETRMIYADWLEEHNQHNLSEAQRWMLHHNTFPHVCIKPMPKHDPYLTHMSATYQKEMLDEAMRCWRSYLKKRQFSYSLDNGKALSIEKVDFSTRIKTERFIAELATRGTTP